MKISGIYLGMDFAHEEAEKVRNKNLLEMADSVNMQIQQAIDEAWATSDAIQGLVEINEMQITAAAKGKYKNAGGHHVHAKAGFKDDLMYDSNTGFSISQKFMNDRNWEHQLMTNKQRELFKDLKGSGRPNTMREHSRIAVESLIAGGATRSEARSLVAESLLNLRSQYVRNPSNIPWYQ